MSSSATGEDALGRAVDEASPSVSPSMEDVLPIRGVDVSTGEAIPIYAAPSLLEADDPFRTDVVRGKALDVSSIMVEDDLTNLREANRIPADIELMLPGPNERAYFPRRGCTALHLNAFRKVIEDLSREGNRTEVAAPDVVEIDDSVVPEGEAPLKRKRKGGASGSGPSQPKKKAVELPSPVDPISRSSRVGPFDSRKKLRKLIGPLGSRISDDMLKNGDEPAVEGAGRVRTRMQEHKKLVAKASKSDKEHQQALEGLQAAMDSMRTWTLDNANAAQKVAAEVLEAANIEKRCLQSESESCELEAQRLRGDLEVSKKGRTEAEAEVARLLGEKKEMEAKLESVEADFIANFHNTDAYTNFSDYFTRVGHQEPNVSTSTLDPLELGFLPRGRG
ncbi:hypothetical protein Adt_42408 [Abeliophyllum distichum]|uniref:Uncharacterized protein n=1 Tax=Abeliophyllum distichum TaxID=126358 RepID=A0ABD1PRL0_9LAMI